LRALSGKGKKIKVALRKNQRKGGGQARGGSLRKRGESLPGGEESPTDTAWPEEQKKGHIADKGKGGASDNRDGKKTAGKISQVSNAPFKEKEERGLSWGKRGKGSERWRGRHREKKTTRRRRGRTLLKKRMNAWKENSNRRDLATTPRKRSRPIKKI